MGGDQDLQGLDLGQDLDPDLHDPCVPRKTQKGLSREELLIREALLDHAAQVDLAVPAAPEALEAREA